MDTADSILIDEWDEGCGGDGLGGSGSVGIQRGLGGG